ncbi:LacI family DNA-binding transcriptional regulator [Cellulomonas sp. KRMCY2]|uniref:LacI family DNA-binding transcriptional regulator n=1 Tax=Cellulomonas sp. KRMCY2 TaxID=1304865 RepID=UPI00045E74C5|nr:LacI family DNA-binding transcriptional regulator [Cellulomonas sp. KRMCY2]
MTIPRTAVPLRRSAPTIRQVAAVAGVSRATASRVINGGHLVSDRTRLTVEAAIAQLGFTPNPVARSLATRRTGSVALVVPEPNSRLLTDPFFGGIINGLSLALDDSDLQVVLLIARPGPSTERAARYLTTGGVDGAVIASHHRDDALNRQLVDSGLPCVFIGRPLDVPNARYVDMDNTLGARMATEHLIASGRRRIGTVAGPPDMTAGIDRLSGWRSAMDAAGLPADAVVYGDFTMRGGAAAVAELIDTHPDVDAVFVASDLMASGALPLLAARGVVVPDDVAVVGFDDIGVAESTSPSLTTVAQPVGEMAARAGLILQAVLAGEDVSTEPVLFEAHLVLRESA